MGYSQSLTSYNCWRTIFRHWKIWDTRKELLSSLLRVARFQLNLTTKWKNMEKHHILVHVTNLTKDSLILINAKKIIKFLQNRQY